MFSCLRLLKPDQSAQSKSKHNTGNPFHVSLDPNRSMGIGNTFKLQSPCQHIRHALFHQREKEGTNKQTKKKRRKKGKEEERKKVKYISRKLIINQSSKFTDNSYEKMPHGHRPLAILLLTWCFTSTETLRFIRDRGRMRQSWGRG